MMLLAEYWKFPVPFTLIVGGLPLGIFLNLLVAITLGARSRVQLQKYLDYSRSYTVQVTMVMVYPAHHVVFLSLHGRSQLAFVLVLPVIKHAFKFATRKMHECDDDLKIALSSSVDVFDALYTIKCMQSTGTLVVRGAVAALDMFLSLVVIQRLNRQSARLHETFAQMQGRGHDQGSPVNGLLSCVCNIVEKTARLDTIDCSSPHKNYNLSTQFQTSLQRMLSVQVSATGPSKRSSLRSVVPIDQNMGNAQVLRQNGLRITMSESQVTVAETARLLHVSESVAVVEYIETVVPVIYAIYIAALFHLPNAKYYLDIHALTDEKLYVVVANILLYTFMELLTLVFVHCMVKHHFGISVFYQLAFTLENEAVIFQCDFVA